MAYLGEHKTSDEAGKTEVVKLERIWIAAEARADKLKLRATKAKRAAEELRRIGDRQDREVILLIGEAERLAARRDQAERDAEAAFEVFWAAKGGS